MLLLLVRHAHAGERDPAHWPDDTQRPLTEHGRDTARAVAVELRRRGLTPTAIFSSPWVRAVESAEVLVRALDPARRIPVQLTSALAADPDLRALARIVGEQPGPAVVAWVGHEPFLSDAASLLLWGSPARHRLEVAKGGIVGIETRSVRAKRGRLRFLIPPDLFAAGESTGR